MNRPRQLIRDFLGVAASQYVARGALLVRGLVAAVALGPHGYGGWNALNLIFDYGSYAAAGAVQGLDLELPAAARRDLAVARRLMAGAWSVVLGGGLVYGLVLTTYLAAGGAAFSVWPGVGLPFLMLAAALLQLAIQYVSSVLRALGRIQAVSRGLVAQAVLGGGLGIALVWRFGPWGLLWGWLIGSSTALLGMKRAVPEAPLRPAAPRVGLTLAASGLPIFACFVATLVLRSVDRVALVRFGEAESLGLYALGLIAVGLVLYVPEAVAFVLFPRIAAAFRGAGSLDQARAASMRAHRAITVLLPLGVALGIVWAEPLVARFLPAYHAGVAAMQILLLGALMLSAATVPGYYLLAAGRPGAMNAIGAAAVLVTAGLVFGVAARTPSPVPVAMAEALGQFGFALAVVLRASREWLAREAALIFASFAPAVWGGGIALLAGSVGPGESWLWSLGRSAFVLITYAPVVVWLGRGVGLRTAVREWSAGSGFSKPV